jgi:hypothetical protein
MKNLLYYISLIIIFIFIGCNAETEKTIINNTSMKNIHSWNLSLRYNTGAVISNDNSTTNINTGNSKTDLKLIDDISFEIAAKYKMINLISSGYDGSIQITTTRFQEVSAFKYCDIYFYDQDNKVLGKIQVKNSEYTYSMKDDNEFAKVCAEEIYKAIYE